MNRIKRWASRPAGKITIALVVILVAARIALPYIILHYANKKLAAMDGYYGKIEDVSVALYRGAYVIDSIYINKVNDAGENDPFFSSAAIDLSLEWKSLFHGKIAGELVFERPFLKFTEDKVELNDVATDTSDFRQLLKDFMPIQVNRCELVNGTVMYADYTTAPVIEMQVDHIDALAQNLRNTYNEQEILPAFLDATAQVHGGVTQLHMRLNPLAEKTTFDMDLKIIDAKLTELNDFFKVYAKADIKEGVFSMYMEAAAKDGQFVGYVKPFIRNLDVLDWNGQDKGDNLLRKLWEGVVGLGGKIFENHKDDKIATKIPLEGSFDSGVKPNIITAIVTVVQNAFFKSLKPAFDYEISIKNVNGKKEPEKKKGILKRIFSKS